MKDDTGSNSKKVWFHQVRIRKARLLKPGSFSDHGKNGLCLFIHALGGMPVATAIGMYASGEVFYPVLGADG